MAAKEGETMRQFFLAVALTHSVNAQLNLQSDKYEIKVLQPDEEAFVSAMQQMDHRFEGREDDVLTLNVRGETQKFKLVMTMPFDPYRRKMSVVL